MASCMDPIDVADGPLSSQCTPSASELLRAHRAQRKQTALPRLLLACCAATVSVVGAGLVLPAQPTARSNVAVPAVTAASHAAYQRLHTGALVAAHRLPPVPGPHGHPEAFPALTDPAASSSSSEGSPTDTNGPLLQRAVQVTGSIAFAVFLMSFWKDKGSSAGADSSAEAAAPLDADSVALMRAEATLVRKLQQQQLAWMKAMADGTVRVRLESGACCMRQPGKEGACSPQPWRGPEYADMDCGEDSFVLTANVIGVSDGVGAWREDGVDPALFANQLMCNVKDLVERPGTQAPPPVELQANGADNFLEHPAMLMHRAFVKIVIHNEIEAGSATCCLARLCPNGLLQVANLGDSCLVVIRNGRCVHHSATGQYRFNAPFQMGVPLESFASDGAVETVATQAGDGIVIATDGLFDNMFDEEISAVYDKNKDAPPRQIAQLLMEQALAISEDKVRDTPFSVMCKKARYKWSGGKGDDISVVVGKVLPV
eukprot:EG_transcript_10888